MRTKIAVAQNYPAALEVKHGLAEKFPDKTFQIRKRVKGKEYWIVERTWPGRTKKEKNNGTSI